MPPVPARKALLGQLLTGPTTTELLVDANGKPVVAVMMNADHPDEDALRLYEQLLRLVTQAGANHSMPPGFPRRQTVFQLRSDLWVDLDRYEVRRGGERIALRAREAEVLRILLRQPRCYVRAEVLADAIGSEGAELASEHPVEEIVSNVRQKLGEIPYRPRLLRCKRYVGYAIFPDEPQSAVAAAREVVEAVALEEIAA
jgi:DNA-binding winged helix-turn-helix (wHTH) protein